jgi:hypothetical protein
VLKVELVFKDLMVFKEFKVDLDFKVFKALVVYFLDKELLARKELPVTQELMVLMEPLQYLQYQTQETRLLHQENQMVLYYGIAKPEPIKVDYGFGTHLIVHGNTLTFLNNNTNIYYKDQLKWQ